MSLVVYLSGLSLHAGSEFLMDLQGIMQINTMGSDHILTDGIQLYEAVG